MKIKLFADGPTLDQLKTSDNSLINGFTFNPSLFKKNGAKDYLHYSKEILKFCNNKPVSLEVFSDEEIGMIEQASILNSLGENIYVKIPICFTNGKSTKSVIQTLVKKGIKLNLTAIFLIDQIKEIINDVKDTETILSVFVGRIYDAGVDGFESMVEINKFVQKNSKCQTLWASTRMPFDFIKAEKSQTNIITMPIENIKKLNNFGYDLKQYSIDTVQQFYNDAKSCGFKI